MPGKYKNVAVTKRPADVNIEIIIDGNAPRTHRGKERQWRGGMMTA